MIDQSGIQLRNPMRSELASLIAACEAEHGPVQTLPIICGADKQIPFVITNPERPKGTGNQSQALRKLDSKRIEKINGNTARRMKNVEIIRGLAAQGATIEAIAQAAGITRKTVMRLMNDYHITRGRQTKLQA